MAEGSSGSLRELVVSLFIKGDKESAKEAENSVDKLAEKFKGLAEVAKVALEAFFVEKTFEFLEHTAEAAEHLARTAARLGTSAEDFQKLDYAAKLTGATTEELTGGLTFLARSMDAANQGAGDQAKAFQRLGVHLKNADGTAKSVQDVFYDVADAMKATDDPGKRARLSMELLGRGSRELIPTLMKGSAALRGFGDEAEQFGVIQGEGFFESAEKFSQGIKRIKAIVGGLANRFAQPLFDSFTGVFRKITAWYKEHSAIIISTVERAGRIIGGLFSGLAQLLEPLVALLMVFFNELAKGDASLKILAAGATLVFAALFPWAALIAVIALAIEDFYTFLQGGDSYFGDFVAAAKDWWEKLKVLFDPTAILHIFTAPFNAVGNWIKEWWDQLDALTDYKLKKITSKMTTAMEPVGTFFSPTQYAADAGKAVGMLFGGGSNAESAAANSSSSVNSASNNFKADIVVNAPPGTSPHDVAGSVTESINEWFDNKMREAYHGLVGTAQ